MAKSMSDKANESLNRDRLTNTARRARMANGAEEDARRSLQIAETMSNIADAIEAGEAKHLAGLRTKVQIELLNEMVNRARQEQLTRQYPDYGEREKHKGDPVNENTADFNQSVTKPKIFKDHIKRLVLKYLRLS